MSPNDLCRKGSESGQQKALFAWSAMATLVGVDSAFDMTLYSKEGAPKISMYSKYAEKRLRWLHAIPNGGGRDKITAARMVAEGARKGVADCFLPVVRPATNGFFPGCYLEFKVGNNKLSEEQQEFKAFVEMQGFKFVTAYTWREAAVGLSRYLGYTGAGINVYF